MDTSVQLLEGDCKEVLATLEPEGWVEALRRVLTSAFQGENLVCDVSDVRPRGTAIKTFGGIACGPGPLLS